MRLPGVRVALMAVALCPVAQATAAEPLGTATPLRYVGPGAAESSQRQVVRTQGGVVYIASVEDDGWGGGAFAELHMYRATTAGIPTAFASQDAANDPYVKNPETLSGGDARIDARGTIHLTFAVRSDDRLTVEYKTFDTVAGRWGASESVTTLPSGGDGSRGRVVSALALGPTGVPLVVTATSSGVSAWSRSPGGGWSRTAIDGARGLHPSLAFDAAGRAHLAWASDPYGHPSIRYAMRAADGRWSAPEIVAGEDVLQNDTLDQSPSLAFDTAARPVVLWLDVRDDVRVTARRAANVWAADDPPPTFAHTPGLYLRGDDMLVFLGHDNDVHPAYLSLEAGGAWSAVSAFPPPASIAGRYAYDGSASTRFDPLFDPDCRTVDVVFFDEDSDRPGRQGGGKPDLFYAAVTLPAPSGGCPPAPGRSGAEPPPSAPLPPGEPPSPPQPAPPAPPSAPPPPTQPPSAPPADAPAIVLGTQALAPQVDSNASGTAEAFQSVAAGASTIHSIAVYVDESSTGEAVSAGLYTDADGHPGALVARGDAVAAKPGTWAAVGLPATPVASGQRYWIAVLGTGGGRLAFRDDPQGGCRSETTPSSLTLDSLPAAWTTGDEYADCPVSAYAR